MVYNQTVSIGSNFNGTILGWASGSFVAAAIITTSTDCTHKNLAECSLVDITDILSTSGQLQAQFNNTDGVGNVGFTYCLIHSEYRKVQSPGDVCSQVVYNLAMDMLENISTSTVRSARS